MPNWNGIEDVSAIPARVWLKRETEADIWTPLRRVDCQALNDNPDDKPILIDGGRATAYPDRGIIRYNFYRRPVQELKWATWFVKKESEDSQLPHLTPMSVENAERVETLYQKAIYAASSFGEGIDTILKESVDLIQDAERGAIPKDGNTSKNGENEILCVKVVKSDSTTLVIRQCSKSWFGKSFDLQRGYGAYTVEGEEDELLMGPVRQVVFVIHGIGEAMWSREDVSVPSIVNQMNDVRISLQRQQVQEWRQKFETAKQKNDILPPPPNRAEFIPIEWYDKLHSSSNSIMKSLKASTLTTVPAIRAIANDVIFDVLMYLTPAFCTEVLECVTEQINTMYKVFLDCHPDFARSGGKASLIGFSLGSVIAWDLLSILKEQEEKRKDVASKPAEMDTPMSRSTSSNALRTASHETRHEQSTKVSTEVGYQHYASEENANVSKNGSWGPSLSKEISASIAFVPDFTLFVGSPLGLFLTLRGAHAVFDELRAISAETSTGMQETNKTKAQLASPFTLPASAIYNIFHPSDPIAYRIEPLLLPQNFLDSYIDYPPPMYLTRFGQDIRIHLKAKQHLNDIRKSVVEKKEHLDGLRKSVLDGGKSVFTSLLNPVSFTAQKLLLQQQSLQQRQQSEAQQLPVEQSKQQLEMIETEVSKPREEDNVEDKKINDGESCNDKKSDQVPVVTTTKNTWASLAASLLEEQKQQRQPAPESLIFPLAGSNHRIDYQLQTGVMDSEYVSALLAHSGYFYNADWKSFFIDLLASRDEQKCVS